MYTWHVLLLPVAVVALVAAHVLLVRRHGVVPPFDRRGAPEAQRAGTAAAPPTAEPASAVMSLATWRADGTRPPQWKGAYRRYDLVKELCIALGVMALLAVVLTVLFSSPDEKPSTVAQWSQQMPADFVTTAVERARRHERHRRLRPALQPRRRRPARRRSSSRRSGSASATRSTRPTTS